MNPRIRQVIRTASTRLKFAHPQAASTCFDRPGRTRKGPPRNGNDLALQESCGQLWLLGSSAFGVNIGGENGPRTFLPPLEADTASMSWLYFARALRKSCRVISSELGKRPSTMVACTLVPDEVEAKDVVRSRGELRVSPTTPRYGALCLFFWPPSTVAQQAALQCTARHCTARNVLHGNAR